VGRGRDDPQTDCACHGGVRRARARGHHRRPSCWIHLHQPSARVRLLGAFCRERGCADLFCRPAASNAGRRARRRCARFSRRGVSGAAAQPACDPVYAGRLGRRGAWRDAGHTFDWTLDSWISAVPPPRLLSGLLERSVSCTRCPQDGTGAVNQCAVVSRRDDDAFFSALILGVQYLPILRTPTARCAGSWAIST
jgi:hypothetical protein